MPGSRLFLWYNERAHEGKVGANVPVSLRGGYESVAKAGLCSEDLWPYRTDRGLFKKKPPARCYRLATSHEARVHHRLRREIGQLRGCLAEGFPFAFGMSCYESIESHAVKRSGHLDLPAPHEKLLGGHAVLAVLRVLPLQASSVLLGVVTVLALSTLPVARQLHVGYVAALVFALYVNSPEVTVLYRQPQVLWLCCPVLLYWQSRIWLLATRGALDSDPVIFALKDRVSYLLGLALLVIMQLAR